MKAEYRVGKLDSTMNDLQLSLSEDDDRDQTRTAILALLQWVPGGGGLEKVLSHFWQSHVERRVRETLVHMHDESRRLRSDIEYLQRRVHASEEAQTLLVEGIQAATTTISNDERKRLGALLARGLTWTDVRFADVRSLLDRWQQLDTVERMIYLEVAQASDGRRRSSLAALGTQYFTGGTHNERMLRDDFHRRRVEHLLDVGLIRPSDPDGWAAKKYDFQLHHFWPSAIGKELYRLIAIERVDVGDGESPVTE